MFRVLGMPPQSRPNVGELRRKVTQELGVGPSDPIYKDLELLEAHWNDRLYAHVKRALDNRMAARNAIPRVGDRIPAPETLIGELLIAIFVTLTGNPAPVCISPDRLVLHTLVAGLPGMGKTFFCRLLLTMIAAACPHVRILIFDPNRSYETLCSDPWIWLSVPWDGIKLGPFVPPPGYPLDRWISEKVDQFCRGELMASRYLFARRLDELIAEARMRADPSGAFVYPAFDDVRENLTRKRCPSWSPEERYRQSLLNVLDGRIRTSGSVYNCSTGMESLLTDTRARISTDGLAPLQSLEFLVTHLIHYACRRRAVQPLVEPPQLHTLIVIEEAQTLLQKHGDNIAYYQELLLKARALGVGFIFVCQDISRIDPIVLAACSNLFVFGQASADDKHTCQKPLDLSPRETALLSELNVGEVFIRLIGHPTFPWPFLARIPDVRLT